MAQQVPSSHRGNFGGRLGFIMAAAGSAVGLGNLWKFPWKAYECGGMSEGLQAGLDHGAGAFVIVYLATVLLVGLPVMMGEILVGRRTGRNPVGAFRQLRPNSGWHIVGGMGVVTGFMILSYYGVVAGRAAFFFLKSLMGELGATATTGREVFEAHVADPVAQVFWLGVFTVLTGLVVAGGVSKGIERVSKILMPALLLMLAYLFIEVMRRPGAEQAWTYLFQPDFSVLTGSLVLEAMGQAFFSLSLGMGAVITYGSYLKRKERIASSAMLICGLDTLVALFASLILFGVLFHLNMTMPGKGDATLFAAIPAIFSQLNNGSFLIVIFFLLVVFAALTSTVSLLEVVVSYLIDQRGWQRRKAVMAVSGGVFALGIPSALSGNLLKNVQLSGRTFFDWIDYLCSNWMLPVGGLLITIFVGWVLTREETMGELDTGKRTHGVWRFCVRYVAPLVVFTVLMGTLLL